MGFEADSMFFHCTECGKKLKLEDFSKEWAFEVDGKFYCFTCVPSDQGVMGKVRRNNSAKPADDDVSFTVETNPQEAPTAESADSEPPSKSNAPVHVHAERLPEKPGFCANCNRAITFEDFEAGKVYNLGGNILCERCAPAMPAGDATRLGLICDKCKTFITPNEIRSESARVVGGRVLCFKCLKTAERTREGKSDDSAPVLDAKLLVALFQVLVIGVLLWFVLQSDSVPDYADQATEDLPMPDNLEDAKEELRALHGLYVQTRKERDLARQARDDAALELAETRDALAAVPHDDDPEPVPETRGDDVEQAVSTMRDLVAEADARLVQNLRSALSGDEGERLDAMRQIGAMGLGELASEVAGQMDSDEAPVRNFAVEVLAMLASFDQAGRALLNAASSHNRDDVRRAATEALADAAGLPRGGGG